MMNIIIKVFSRGLAQAAFELTKWKLCGGGGAAGGPGRGFPDVAYMMQQQSRDADMRDEYPQLRNLAILLLVANVLAIGVDPPNILLVYPGDHSPRMLVCHEEAYSLANTPNIDRLASQGVRFNAAYLGSWCIPSRASVLTGLDPHAIKSMRMTGRNPRSTYDPEKCRFWLATAYFRDQFVDRNGVRETKIGFLADQYSQWAADYIMGEGRHADRSWFQWLCDSRPHETPKACHLVARTSSNDHLRDLSFKRAGFSFRC